MSVLSYPFHFLPFKLPNKGMGFPFPLLKLPNKGREEYSKIILFIPFLSIPFPPPKRGLKARARERELRVMRENIVNLYLGKSENLA